MLAGTPDGGAIAVSSAPQPARHGTTIAASRVTATVSDHRPAERLAARRPEPVRTSGGGPPAREASVRGTSVIACAGIRGALS